NPAKKLEEKWEGPFYIHDIGLNRTYQLRNIEGKVRKRFVHAN
ncbi:418_t:CDS:1, partial [Entrophospora sp. SA101]